MSPSFSQKLSMDPTKSRGRSKLFNCFKPVTDDDDDLGMTLPPSSGDESCRRRKKKIFRDLFVALNAVFFKMSLKKSPDENSRRDFHELRSKLSSKSKKLLKSMKKNFSHKSFLGPDKIFRTNSSRSSSLFSSNSSRHTTSSTSLSSHSSAASSFPSRSASERNIKRSVSLDFGHLSPVINRQKSMKRKNHGNQCTHEMCIFLVCLVALVFWGKVFAIVTCTSTWLFFGSPRRGHRIGKADLLVNDVVDPSEEYTKRVVMEGLLERNRSRVF